MSAKVKKIFNRWLPNSLLAYQVQIMLRPAVLFFMSVVWVKCGLTKTEIGQLEYVLLITSGLSFFWIGGIFNVFQATFQQITGSARSQFVFRTAIQIWIHSFLATVIASIGGVLDIWGESLGKMFPYALLLTFIQPFGWFLDAYLLANRRAKLQWITAFFFNAFLVLGISIIAIVAPSAEAIFGWYCFIIGLKWLFAAYEIHRYNKPNWDWKAYKADFKNSLPLTGSMLLGGMGSYFNPFWVAQQAGMAVLAIFRYGSRDFPLVQIPSGALSTYAGGIIQPNAPDAGLKELREKSKQYQKWLIPTFGLLLALAPWLYTNFYSENFRESALIFAIFLLLGPIRLFFPQSVLTALHAHKAQMTISAIELILHIILVIWWYPIWGLVGVSIATIVAFAIEKIILVGWLWHKFGISPNQYHSFKGLGFHYGCFIIGWIIFFMIYLRY